MRKNEFSKLRIVMKEIKSLGKMPKEADPAYFESLQDKIMDKIESQVDCSEVQECLVDFIENNIPEKRAVKIRKHIDQCETCTKDYQLSLTLVSSAKGIRASGPNDTYFESLTEKIEQRIFEEGIQTTICEKTRLFITDKLAEQEIPKEVEAHLVECEECAREVIVVDRILSNLKALYIPSPSQKYFEEMLENIDRKIECLPSHRIIPEYQRVSFRYLADIFDTLKTAIMHPYVAVALSAMVTLVVVGGKFFSSPDVIEEKQINLSDVISKNPTDMDNQKEGGINIYTTAYKDLISDPKEDEKLQINTTGTAKREDDRDRPTKRLN